MGECARIAGFGFHQSTQSPGCSTPSKISAKHPKCALLTSQNPLVRFPSNFRLFESSTVHFPSQSLESRQALPASR
ncbi:Carboxynorspermidine decarboxylase, putative [Altererythrobacter epoxidivorans]|uniref:Carboxynorspermidine decarboxylase, putative n=1 Tax=Altererythrobacter epoxidivorans TaxID=361183 RepID=A0A0M4MSN4_9SPHN|nr:Carboxynorspermidine decarboxylase, putative [Altererythrobacter epoxidivorans]